MYMPDTMIRRLFPGSNTHAGFFGFFENLRSQASRCLILKGGPGVGKSTLMGAVGKYFEEKHQPVVYYHCSGDPDSLDAVFAPEAGYLILDGTAPHIVDPILPGAEDGILNLGICLNERELTAHRAEISAIAGEIQGCYARAYRYLSAAHTLRQDAAAIYDAAFSPASRRALENELLSLLPGGPEGPVHHAFAQAITCQGVIQQVDSILEGPLCCLDLPWGFDADALLAPLVQGAKRSRLAMQLYHDPLDGEKLCHIRLGSRVFTTAVMMDAPSFTPELDKDLLRRAAPRLAFDRAVYDLTLNQAIEALAEAKERHDQMERYYIDAMDYSRLTAIREEVMESLP